MGNALADLAGSRGRMLTVRAMISHRQPARFDLSLS